MMACASCWHGKESVAGQVFAYWMFVDVHPTTHEANYGHTLSQFPDYKKFWQIKKE